MRMRIKTKFIAIGVSLVSVISISAYITYNGIHKMDILADTLQKAGDIRFAQMEGDMMHDAIRSDVSDIVKSTLDHDAQNYQKNIHDIEEHSKRATEVMQKLQAADVPEDLKGEIHLVADQFKEYLALAKAMTEPGLSLPELQKTFIVVDEQYNKLEKSQEEYEDISEKWVTQLKHEQDEVVARTENLIALMSFLSVILSILVPVYAIYAIFRPQAQMMDAMQQLADGNTKVAVPHTGRTDEMGDMARTVQVFKENAIRISQLAEDQKRQEQELALQRKKTREEMADAFETSVKHVVDTVASAATEMDATSRSVASIASDNQERLGELSSQIGTASSNVDMVASASSQLSAAINEINKQVSRATHITATAVSEAQKADGTVTSLAEAAQRIGEVVEMINSIAAQINLLALNATIEAARAGDAGKGFAVVASEVKSLATQTTKATEQIVQYINSMQNATNDTVSTIKTIGGTIREINEISTAIAAAVEEQGAATQEIAHNVQQASSMTGEVANSAGTVTEKTREAGESASQMMIATAEMAKQSEVLRNEVDKFLANVRQG